jgi:hypothetical protein
MLRRITFQIHHKDTGDVLPDAIVIADAPLLRAVHIAASNINFDLPWSQLTSLFLLSNINLEECIDLLLKCPALINLTVSIYDIQDSSARTRPHITLSALESVSVNSGPSSVLHFLTLPRLRVLNLTDLDHNSPDALTSLIQRSSCILQQLTLALSDIEASLFPALLLAVPHSVSRLDLWMGYNEHVDEVITALSAPNVLPALHMLYFRASRLHSTHFTAFADMLHTLRSAHPSLNSFEAQLHVRVAWKPSTALLAALQALANAGLNIRIEVVSRVRSATTVIKSGGNGTYVIFDSSAASNKLQVFLS